jgi:hypothetical protein
MNSKLALRRQSIRTLTVAEMSLAHGGRGAGGNNTRPTEATKETVRTTR